MITNHIHACNHILSKNTVLLIMLKEEADFSSKPIEASLAIKAARD